MKHFSSVHFLVRQLLKTKDVCGPCCSRFHWFHYFLLKFYITKIFLYVVWFEVFTALLSNAVKTLDNNLNVPGRHGAGNFQRAFCSSAVGKVLWSRRVQFAVNGQTKWDRRLIMWLTPWRRIMGEYFWIRRALLRMFYIGFTNSALNESKKKV